MIKSGDGASGDDGGGLAPRELPELGQLEAEGDQPREGLRWDLVQLAVFLLVLLNVPGGLSRITQDEAPVRGVGGVKGKPQTSCFGRYHACHHPATYQGE